MAAKTMKAYHVEEQSEVSALNSCVNVSIWADDVGGFATKLQSDRDNVLCCLLHDDLADLCGTCECQLQTDR